MKVIKLKAGYVIRLSESEFEALNFMLASPDALERHAHQHLSKGAKAAIRRAPFTDIGGPLGITDDRRNETLS